MPKHPLTDEQKLVFAFTFKLLVEARVNRRTAARHLGYPADTLYRWGYRYVWSATTKAPPEMAVAIRSLQRLLPRTD